MTGSRMSCSPGIDGRDIGEGCVSRTTAAGMVEADSIVPRPLRKRLPMHFRPAFAFCASVLATLILATPSYAARCGGDFNTFVAAMSQEAAASGISQGVISQALGGVQQDGGVLAFDRRQRGTFNKSFEQYVSTRVGAGRINGGRAMMQRHAALLSRIEQRFGVPPQIIVAIWGLEPDFGRGDMGRLPVLDRK